MTEAISAVQTRNDSDLKQMHKRGNRRSSPGDKRGALL